METFTGTEYLYISIANTFGIKGTFQDRINWVKANESDLENKATEAHEELLYAKAVRTLRKTQQGISTGFLCGLDATCSGAQLMSVLMGCKSGIYATGLGDPDKPADAYTSLIECMNSKLKTAIDRMRKDTKQAFMTFLYGSKAKPIEIFGKGTSAYASFFEAMDEMVPGAVELRNLLIKAWNPKALEHTFTMPDGFEAVIRTTDNVSYEFSIDNLPDAKYVLHYKAFQAKAFSLELAAHVIHAFDGFIVREMNRRCNYNPDMIGEVYNLLRSFCKGRIAEPSKTFISLNMISEMTALDMNTLCRLRDLCEEVLQHRSFDLLCIHDNFLAHPNHMNNVRYWYKEILAELSESNALENVLYELYGEEFTIEKEDIAPLIRNSNYGIH